MAQRPDAANPQEVETKALQMPIVGRRPLLRTATEVLQRSDGDRDDGRLLLVRGDSGTGKTFLVHEAIRRHVTDRPSTLSLYVDVARDEFQSRRTLASLLKLSLVPGPMLGTSVVNVPDDADFGRYRRKSRKRGAGRGLLRTLARAIGVIFGLGSAVGAALNDFDPDDPSEVEEELIAYLRWAAKKRAVIVAVDNIQFLNLDDRLTLESAAQRVGKNLRLIAIDRTVAGDTLLDVPLRCFPDSQTTIVVPRLTASETQTLVSATLGPLGVDVARLSTDIFNKTDGLAKDVEYCIRAYVSETSRGTRADAVEGLLATVHRLPLMHRQFLIIASLLDGGVEASIARGTVGRITAASDDNELERVVEELVATTYLRLNGESGNRLRPGHERVVTAIEELAETDLQEEVRRSLVLELAQAVERERDPDAETYLLHCLIGIQTAHELRRNVDLVSRLVRGQHRRDQFSYLVMLADELHDLLHLLPADIVDDLLNAMQKASAFDKGLQVLQLLATHASVEGRDAFRVKYLAQAYRYDEALALIEASTGGDDEWLEVERTTVLMALDRDDDALVATERSLNDAETEAQAVLRRNTVHLFDPGMAHAHLDQAERFFERRGADFALATIKTNRSLVYLHEGRFGDANRAIASALDVMAGIGSREIYQAQLNDGIRLAALGDYKAAMHRLNEARVHVPHALLFDQVKIDVNRVLAQFLASELNIGLAVAELERLAAILRNVQTPYLDRVIAANTAALSGSVAEWPQSNRVSLTSHVVHGSLTLGFPMSVHWRY